MNCAAAGPPFTDDPFNVFVQRLTRGHQPGPLALLGRKRKPARYGNARAIVGAHFGDVLPRLVDGAGNVARERHNASAIRSRSRPWMVEASEPSSTTGAASSGLAKPLSPAAVESRHDPQPEPAHLVLLGIVLHVLSSFRLDRLTASGRRDISVDLLGEVPSPRRPSSCQS